MPKQYTIEDLYQQIRELEETMRLPGIPADEIAIYKGTIQRIHAEINARKSAPITPAPTPPPPEQIKHTAPPIPSSTQLSESSKLSESSRQTLPPPTPPPHQPPINQSTNHQPITVRTPGAQQTPSAIPATLEVHHDTDPHNPEITIIWADGYTLRVNEAAARSRFKSTFQDTHALKVVKERRFEKIWRWDSPWRCAGFYQALTYFYGGQAPTAYQCGIRYPSDTATIIFQLITHTALATESGKTTVK